MLYDISAEVPDEAYTVPFGEAGIIREGEDVTLISVGKMVNVCQEAANELAKEMFQLHFRSENYFTTR